MAGAFDRDYDIKTGATPTGPTAPIYKDPIQVKTELGATQKEYIDTRSKTRVELDGIVKTLGQIKAEIDKDPVSTKYNLNGVEVTRKELLAYYEDTSASTELALKLQTIIDANDNANAGANKQAQELLKSDAIFTSQGTSGISNTGKYYLNGVEVSKEEFGNGPTGINRGGGSSGGTGTGGTGGTTPTIGTGPTTGTAKMDAIAAISALLSSYGLGDLSAPITEAVQKGYTSDTIQLIMQDPNSKDPLAVAFQTRFPANKTRLTAGKSVLSAAEYLQAERSYTQVLQSYGVSNLATKDKLNSFISNDVSATEVADRVGLAIDRVKNADPFTKAALAQYYPMLNQGDIVAAVLDPAEGLPALKRKVTIAEIGGAAAVQGLKTGLSTTSGVQSGYEGVETGSLGAEALAQFGITQDQARKGYEYVADVSPRAEFLSSISGGEDYTRLEAEQEAFLGLASAKRKRVSLTEQEQSRFSQKSGRVKTSLTDMSQGQY
jgi:hypothetical protein